VTPADCDGIVRGVADLDGWMTAAQGQRLCDAARRSGPGARIVEIGSFRGKSTVVLASAAPEAAEVIAIDPHAGTDRGPNEISGFDEAAEDDFAVFHANLNAYGLKERVHHVREFSDRAHSSVEDPIDLLYIDGAHRYRPAVTDITEWGHRVSDGGTLLIHDAFSSIGVTLAVCRRLIFGSRYRYVGRSGSLVEYRADLGPGLRVRARNSVRQMLQMGWFVRNVALKIAITIGLGRLARRCGRREPVWPY
jgi:hypothetical protein